uniref:Ectonucleoside triphosphate diphosphohydrolase 8 n=1 Tax=Zosterops lateralis melanops TaxID=1220523 RepID=A0A8D2NYU5_ZOSLA
MGRGLDSIWGIRIAPIGVEGGGGRQPGLPSPHILTCRGIFCHFPSPAVSVGFCCPRCLALAPLVPRERFPSTAPAELPRDRSRAQGCGRQGCSGGHSGRQGCSGGHSGRQGCSGGHRWEAGMLRGSQGGGIQPSWGVGPALWGGLWEGSGRPCSPTNGRVCVQANSSAQFSHPCYPRGYQEQLTVAELYDSPCVPRPSGASPGLVLTVTGTGEPAACASAVQRLFNFSCPGAQGPCGFNGVHQPPVRGQFFAFAGFYYTFNFLNLTHQESLSEVNATILSFCRRNWTELEQSFPNDLKYLPTYCSVGIYILTLLLQGYKFDEHTWTNIHFSKQAANTDIGWTLGYMLNLTNMIPAEALQHLKGHQPGLWAGTVSLLVLAILAGLVALFLHCFWKTK